MSAVVSCDATCEPVCYGACWTRSANGYHENLRPTTEGTDSVSCESCRDGTIDTKTAASLHRDPADKVMTGWSHFDGPLGRESEYGGASEILSTSVSYFGSAYSDCVSDAVLVSPLFHDAHFARFERMFRLGMSLLFKDVLVEKGETSSEARIKGTAVVSRVEPGRILACLSEKVWYRWVPLPLGWG